MSDSFRHLDTLTTAPKPGAAPALGGWAQAANPASLDGKHPVAGHGPADAGRRRQGDPPADGPPGYPADYAGQQPGSSTHLLDYVRILYRRRWLAGTAFVLVVVAAIVAGSFSFKRVGDVALKSAAVGLVVGGIAAILLWPFFDVS